MKNSWLKMVVLLAPLMLSHCVEVSGGAVEARWDLRDSQGVRTDCVTAQVLSVQLVLRPLDQEADPCAIGARCLFACDRGVGDTAFDIPVGEYAMSLQVVGEEGRVLGPGEGVVTPAPTVRQVFLGQLTNLNVNMIVVNR